MPSVVGGWWLANEDGKTLDSGKFSGGPSYGISAGWSHAFTRGSDLGFYLGYLQSFNLHDGTDTSARAELKTSLFNVGGMTKLYLLNRHSFRMGIGLEVGLLLGIVSGDEDFRFYVGANGVTNVFMDLPLTKGDTSLLLTFAVGLSGGFLGAESNTTPTISSNLASLMFPLARIGLAYGSR
jgi:hypothetical protein